VCTINNGIVSFIGVGTCTIDANQGGDATFAPAAQEQQWFGVSNSGGTVPTVTCLLPRQVSEVGDTVNLDLSQLFAPPASDTLSYGVTNAPPALSIMGSLLTGTLDTAGTFTSTLTATAVAGGGTASENVEFRVLPTGDILLRNGFDNGNSSQPCQ
jgi:hypothetical protein